MGMAGYLANFSIPEIFQVIGQGSKTGVLSIGTSAVAFMTSEDTNYFWFKKGEVVAAASSLNERGLLSLIEEKGWINSTMQSKLIEAGNQAPLGLNLKSANLLEVEQLSLLYQIQVVQSLSALLQLKKGWFSFKDSEYLPNSEMTGVTKSAGEVILTSLRNVDDLSPFADKLPETNSSLVRLLPESASNSFSLKRTEQRILSFSDGSVSLKNMAGELGLSEQKIVEIAFRLIMSGLVEESVVVRAKPQTKLQSSVSQVDNNHNYKGSSTKGDSTVSVAVTATDFTDKPVQKTNNHKSNGFAEEFQIPIEQKNREIKDNPMVVKGKTSGGKLVSDPFDDSEPPQKLSRNFLQNLVSFLKK